MSRHDAFRALLALSAIFLRVAAPGAPDPVQARLVADRAAVRPGETFHAGVVLEIADGFHVYWRNSGVAGMPTRVAWSLPEELVAGPSIWPVPERHEVEGVGTTYVHANRLVLQSAVRVSPEAKPGERVLRATVSWMVCDEEGCATGESELELPVRVLAADAEEASEAGDPKIATLLEETRLAAPRAITTRDPVELVQSYAAGEDGGSWTLILEPPEQKSLDRVEVWPHAAPGLGIGRARVSRLGRHVVRIDVPIEIWRKGASPFHQRPTIDLTYLERDLGGLQGIRPRAWTVTFDLPERILENETPPTKKE